MKPGQFFKHDRGRSIAVLGQVESFKFGATLVIEETDHTGHSLSCVDADSELNDNWVEIGKEEWERDFKNTLPKKKEVFYG